MKRLERMTVYFSGRVQGVGFRFTTRRIAEGFEVTGTVRNLRDGRVEVVAEGAEEELTAFRKSIEATMAGYISAVDESRQPASGGFTDFRITY